jgi:tetratricopeptide (TPR) repeat protein
MTFQNFRTLLLLSTTLTLIGCDQSSDTSENQSSARQDDIIGFLTQQSMQMPPPTVAGNYLIGQYAQNKSDWNAAANYFSQILMTSETDEDIQKRVMALEMGSGDYESALKLAKIISEGQNKDKALANLLLSFQHFKAGQYTQSLQIIETYQDDALGMAIMPLLKAWADAGQGKTDVSGLLSTPALLYQAVLVASYTQDKKVIAELAKNYNFVQTPIPVSRLEDVATIFAHYGETDEAKSILIALKSALPDNGKRYDKQIEDLYKTPLPALPSGLDTPQKGLSEAIFDMAQLLANGYPDSGRLFAHLALYLNQDNAKAYELLAEIASTAQLYSEATDYLMRIDTKDNIERHILITRQIAQLQANAGHFDEAIRILEKLVSTHNNIDAQIQIADMFRGEEKYEEALEAYKKALTMLGGTITAEYWNLAFARGMVYERLKQWDKAEADLQTALNFQPDQPYILNYLGYSWADQGINLDKAAEMIEKAVRLRPEDGAIVDSLGWVYYRMGQYDKAVKTLERAIELDPTEPEINDHLGDAYWKVGRKSEARFQWKRALSFSKDDIKNASIQQKIDFGLPVTQAESKVESATDSAVTSKAK